MCDRRYTPIHLVVCRSSTPEDRLATRALRSGVSRVRACCDLARYAVAPAGRESETVALCWVGALPPQQRAFGRARSVVTLGAAGHFATGPTTPTSPPG